MLRFFLDVFSFRSELFNEVWLLSLLLIEKTGLGDTLERVNERRVADVLGDGKGIGHFLRLV